MPLIVRLLFTRQRRIYGQELVAAKVWARVPSLFLAFARCFAVFGRKRSPFDATLRGRVAIKVAQTLECPFCVDFNSYLLLKRGKRTEVTEADKVAVEYAEVICVGEVSDELFERVRAQFSEEEVVELTALVVLQIASSRFNVTLKIPSQGLCEIPETSRRSGVSSN